MTNFQKSNASLACQKAPSFEREDWSLFRTIEGLQQRAGVTKNLLPRLVLKEIADNGLDMGAVVRLLSLPEKGGYVVEDDGRGIDGAPEDIARLFSINRPMVSTKLLRLPTRGALGNGLRVVTGAILVSGGSLVVTTRNRRIVLRPERDGTTTIISVEAVEFPVGTRIEVHFGPTLPCDQNTLYWAEAACRLAQRSSGRPTSAGRARGGTTPRNSTSCCSPAPAGRCASWSHTLTDVPAARRGRSSPKRSLNALSVETSPLHRSRISWRPRVTLCGR